VVTNYTWVILILSTYQYLEFYVLGLMIIMIGPFYWGKKLAANIMKRRLARKIAEMLKGAPFKRNS
jgi:hypothetical protein